MLTDRILVVIDSTSNGAVQEMDRLKKSTKDADTGVAALGRSLKTGLVAGAAALAGAGLVSFLNDSAQAFVGAQDAAAKFARATNASVEEAGKFTTVTRSLGLDMNDLIEINAEFSQKIQKQPGLLRELNVEIARNADGSTNMTKTLVATLDALGGMEDGLKAAQIASQLFGEEGAKQLAGFYLAGIKVADLMERFDFTDQSDTALRYKAATLELGLAFEQLQITLGAAIVPGLTALTDALSAGLAVAAEIEAPVYAAAAAFVALNYAVRSGALASGISTVATALTGLGAIGPGIAALGASAAPIAAVVAALVVLNSVLKDSANAKSFITDSNNLQGSLGEQAAALQETQSAWTRFLRIGVGREMAEITKNSREAALASLASADATEGERAAAQGLLDVLGEGSLKQQQANLNTKEGQAAQQAYADSLSASAAAAQKAAAAQTDLADLIANGITSGQEFAAALSAAADAQLRQEQNTRLQADALAVATGNLGYFIEKLQQLESFEGSGMESLKQQLIGISLVDDPDTSWVNEFKIGAEQAGDAIQNELIAALERTPDLDVSAWFAQLRAGAPPEIQAIIDTIQSQFNADGGVKAIIDAEKGPGFTAAETAKDALVTPATGSIDFTTTGLPEAKAAIDAVAAPTSTSLVVNAEFAPGGYQGVKARMDYLAQMRQGAINIATAFEPGGYEAVKSRADFLARPRTGSITINTAFAPGSYVDVMARINNIARNRSATITLNTVTTGGGAAAASRATAPINMFRVSIDGRELRSYIRAEMAAARPRPVEVLP